MGERKEEIRVTIYGESVIIYGCTDEMIYLFTEGLNLQFYEKLGKHLVIGAATKIYKMLIRMTNFDYTLIVD